MGFYPKGSDPENPREKQPASFGIKTVNVLFDPRPLSRSPRMPHRQDEEKPGD
jgi:hypothetical protein